MAGFLEVESFSQKENSIVSGREYSPGALIGMAYLWNIILTLFHFATANAYKDVCHLTYNMFLEQLADSRDIARPRRINVTDTCNEDRPGRQNLSHKPPKKRSERTGDSGPAQLTRRLCENRRTLCPWVDHARSKEATTSILLDLRGQPKRVHPYSEILLTVVTSTSSSGNSAPNKIWSLGPPVTKSGSKPRILREEVISPELDVDCVRSVSSVRSIFSNPMSPPDPTNASATSMVND
ncbi:hypothetical protein T265_07781 [Opisthorchis viverrini]|uniref:Uncharacterized protein n=1 Tax=Opisthorchis viverrini TaxID=6198 RepID=A0A075AAJ0_OPIVI|nr:hypothetical protein T265_07781 [Opisthorchis viverrini]KER24584.1 hypothetical protein T265_07781 [Opisthorchis viverrini]